MVESQSSKLITRVRFPSSPPIQRKPFKNRINIAVGGGRVVGGGRLWANAITPTSAVSDIDTTPSRVVSVAVAEPESTRVRRTSPPDCAFSTRDSVTRNAFWTAIGCMCLLYTFSAFFTQLGHQVTPW